MTLTLHLHYKRLQNNMEYVVVGVPFLLLRCQFVSHMKYEYSIYVSHSAANYEFMHQMVSFIMLHAHKKFIDCTIG
jgi:hypothetical protein